MDPATIVGLVSSAVALATICGSAAKELNTLVSKYKNAKLAILSMVQGLDIMQLAWSKIGKWAQNQTPYELLEEDDFIGRLRRSLETGSLVLDGLKEELLIYKPLKMGLTQRTKVVWNEGTLRSHQERIRDQASSMTLLLQAIHLPTFRDRDDLLQRSEKQFEMADESAYSIVPSRMSMSISTCHTTGSGASKNEENLVYKPLAFENELFTTRVYKRNYRTPALQRLFKGTEQETSDKTRPRAVAQKVAEDPDGSEAENCKIREPGPARWWHIKAQPTTLRPTEEQPARVEDTSGEINTSPNAEPPISFANACEQGYVATVENFLQSGQSVHVPVSGEYGKFEDLSAIHIAAKGGHIQVVESLLSYGADGEMLSRFSLIRPLHLAVQAGHVAMVRYLLDKGTNIAAADGESAQAIHVAAECGSTVILSFLLDRGAAIESAMTYGDQPLHMASRNPGRANVINFLCSQGADIEAKTHHGYTPLYYASLHNNVENMKALLELGATHSPQGPSILSIALEHGHVQATRLLLERGMHPNRPVSGGRTALHKLFKAYKAGVSFDRLHLPEFAEIVELLLVYGADVDLQDSNGATPLHCLCSRTEIQIEARRLQIQLAEILLRGMRNVDTVNFAGETALGISTKSRSGNWLSQLLIDSGARLLLSKPGTKIGLNLERSATGDPSILGHLSINCKLQPGYTMWTNRLGDYEKHSQNNIFSPPPNHHWTGVLRRLLCNLESLDLKNISWSDYADTDWTLELTSVPSMLTGESYL